MNMLEVLQNARQLIAQVKLEKDNIKETAGELLNYTEKDGAIPQDLAQKLVGDLQNVCNLQNQFIANYQEVMGTEEIPDELTMMEANLASKKEELTKGEFVRAAAAFMHLHSDDAAVEELLDSYKAEVRLNEACTMTPEEVADDYQKYVDFNEALAEDDASLRISYIYRLDEFFPAELLASVIILRNIAQGDAEAIEDLAQKAFAGKLDENYFTAEAE